MKVAICSDYFYPKIGGITTHIENLAKSLKERGREVIIVSRKAKFNDKEHDLNVIRIESLDIPNTLEIFFKSSQTKRILKNEMLDVIHSHHAFSPISLFSLSIGKKLGIKTVLTNHSIQFLYNFDVLWKPSSILLFPRQAVDQ